jgi:hypothetical protein
MATSFFFTARFTQDAKAAKGYFLSVLGGLAVQDLLDIYNV